MARDERINIRLRSDVKEEFQQMADELGMTISALGSYVIGKFVRENKKNAALQEKILEPMIDEMVKAFVDDADENVQIAGIFEMMADAVKKRVEMQNRP
ncbi:hypothetical protein GA8_00020 [Geobacillus sp. A8]|jgi:antitoxin component of RelBE/YafQ-DinJ toxin-antitoxin module|uniref:hypothetical protein n=1 Tax=Geobacillus sp. A8 TaxID=1095383 RepID=UPI00038A10D6|nr:hypothetical protein [Geobacillus sp. A8]EQB97643.1 hypothetical protein GA8_00020 [Geobacillus sp. A8]